MYKTRHRYDVTNPNDRAQLECLRRAIQRKRFGCFFQQRVGKSRVGVEFAGNAIAQGVDRVLVLCPPSAVTGWLYEIAHMGYAGRPVYMQHWAAGNEPLSTQRPMVLLVTYDLMVANDVTIVKYAPQCIVFDEVHMLKNISTRHKVSRKIADKAEWVLGLTGTPFSNREFMDVYGVFRIIDPSIFGKSKAAFIDAHASVLDDYRNPVSWRKSSEDFILKAVAEASYRVTREDVGIELDSNEHVIAYDLDVTERTLYEQMRDTSIATVGSTTCIARHTWAWKTRLQQITCGILPNTETAAGGFEEIGWSRVEALERQLRATYDTQVVVVVRYRQDLGRLMAMAKRIRPVFRIMGGATRAERLAALEDAKKTSHSVLFVQERTVAMGMDLSFSNTMIFYSWSDDAILHSQVKDRITGRFQTRTVHYLYIVARHTVDGQYLRSTKQHISKADRLANWEAYRSEGSAYDESMETL